MTSCSQSFPPPNLTPLTVSSPPQERTWPSLIQPHFLVFAITIPSAGKTSPQIFTRLPSSLHPTFCPMCVSFMDCFMLCKYLNCWKSLCVWQFVHLTHLQPQLAHCKCSDTGVQSPANLTVFAVVNQWVLFLFLLLLPFLFHLLVFFSFFFLNPLLFSFLFLLLPQIWPMPAMPLLMVWIGSLPN